MQEHTNPKTAARRRGKRFPPVMLVVACLPLLLHCAGGDGGGSIVQPAKIPVFTASGTAGAGNLVTLSSPGTETGSLIKVDVDLGGPTTATSIWAFSFDIVLSNPSIVREVTYTPGDALTGDQVNTLVTLVGDRVVVGVSKFHQTTPGNGVGAGGAKIVHLTFKTDVNSPGTTTLTFDPAKAIVESPRKVCSEDSAMTCSVDGDCPAGQKCQGERITSIHFDTATAQIEQPK
jgi:hypothetical protein